MQKQLHWSRGGKWPGARTILAPQNVLTNNKVVTLLRLSEGLVNTTDKLHGCLNNLPEKKQDVSPNLGLYGLQSGKVDSPMPVARTTIVGNP